MTIALVTLAFLLANALYWTRKARRKPDGRDCAPLTRHERENAWRTQMIAETDDYLAVAWRGAAAKNRMLTELRTRAARSRALPPYRPSCAQVLEHFGVGARTRRDIEIRPLKSIAPRAPTIVRKRAVLRLAR